MLWPQIAKCFNGLAISALHASSGLNPRVNAFIFVLVSSGIDHARQCVIIFRRVIQFFHFYIHLNLTHDGVIFVTGIISAISFYISASIT